MWWTRSRQEETRGRESGASGSPDQLGFRRRDRPSPANQLAIVLLGAAGGVDVALHDGAPVWACSSCGELLGAASENFKLACSRRDFSPPQVDSHLYPDPAEFGDAEIVLRQYVCPGCATLLAQEFCRRGDDPWRDFRLELDGLRDE